MNLLFGIGNVLCRDDGAGIYVAEHFSAEGWRCYACGTAPENFTSLVRREHPDHLLLVDAADMGLAAGEIRIIPENKVADVGIGTHQMPLSHLMDYLRDSVDTITLVGIQPAVCSEGEGLSAPVAEAAEYLIRLLKAGNLETITFLTD